MRMKQLKEQDRKKYGDEGIKLSLVHTNEKSCTVANSSDNLTLTEPVVRRCIPEDKIQAPGKKMLETRPSKRARTIQKIANTQGLKEAIDSSQNQNDLDPIEQMINEAKAEICRNAAPRKLRLDEKLKSNAPKGTVCNICYTHSASVSLVTIFCCLINIIYPVLSNA